MSNQIETNVKPIRLNSTLVKHMHELFEIKERLCSDVLTIKSIEEQEIIKNNYLLKLKWMAEKHREDIIHLNKNQDRSKPMELDLSEFYTPNADQYMRFVGHMFELRLWHLETKTFTQHLLTNLWTDYEVDDLIEMVIQDRLQEEREMENIQKYYFNLNNN